MGFAEHRENAEEAAKAAALEVADEMRGGGWTLDDIVVGLVPSAVAAFLARLRTPEAIVAWWGEARDRQGGYAEAESDAHSLALSTWLLDVLAGDDD